MVVSNHLKELSLSNNLSLPQTTHCTDGSARATRASSMQPSWWFYTLEMFRWIPTTWWFWKAGNSFQIWISWVSNVSICRISMSKFGSVSVHFVNGLLVAWLLGVGRHRLFIMLLSRLLIPCLLSTLRIYTHSLCCWPLTLQQNHQVQWKSMQPHTSINGWEIHLEKVENVCYLGLPKGTVQKETSFRDFHTCFTVYSFVFLLTGYAFLLTCDWIGISKCRPWKHDVCWILKGKDPPIQMDFGARYPRFGCKDGCMFHVVLVKQGASRLDMDFPDRTYVHIIFSTFHPGLLPTYLLQ